MHATSKLQIDGYRVVRPQPRPPDLRSFVGTASKSGAVPPISKLNRFIRMPLKKPSRPFDIMDNTFQGLRPAA